MNHKQYTQAVEQFWTQRYQASKYISSILSLIGYGLLIYSGIEIYDYFEDGQILKRGISRGLGEIIALNVVPALSAILFRELIKMQVERNYALTKDLIESGSETED